MRKSELTKFLIKAFLIVLLLIPFFLIVSVPQLPIVSALNITVDTNPSPDMGIASLDNRTFVVAWVDGNENDVTFSVYDTNGTNLTGPIDVATSANANTSRVSVAAINSTDFIIEWYEDVAQDVIYAVYTRTGANSVAAVGLDTGAGTSSDTSAAAMMNGFNGCDIDQAGAGNTPDATTNAVTYGTWSTITSTDVDTAVGTIALQDQLLSCSAINNTRFVFMYFDDADVDTTFSIRDQTGASVVGATDIDTNAGADAQVAAVAINQTYFAMAWYNSLSNNITLNIRDRNNNVLLAQTLVDLNATSSTGGHPRLAMAEIWNSSEKEEWFILAWNDRNAGNINATVYNVTGTIKGSFILAADQNTTSPIFDVRGNGDLDNSTGGPTINGCPNTFLFAYTNNTGSVTVRTYYINGSEWDGVCGAVAVAGAVNTANITDKVSLNAATQISVRYKRTSFQLADITDSVKVALSGLRASAQVVDLNEFVVAFLRIPRGIAQTFSINNAVTTIFGTIRSLFQIVDLNESTFRTFIGLRAVFQIIDLNDAVFRIFAGLRGVFQIVDLNDAVNSMLGKLTSVFQIVDLNDGVTRLFKGFGNIFEVVDLNDAIFRIFSGFRGLFQIVDLNDAVARFITIPRFIAQVVDINDAVFRIYATLRNTFQVVDINEAVARIFIGLRNVFQIIDINDAIFRIFSGFRNIFQNFQIITATNASVTQGVQSYTREAFQVVDLNDAVFRIFIGIRGVFQIADINDAVFKIFGSLRNIFQIVDLNDSVAKIFGSLRSVFQVVDINDAISRTFIGLRGIFQIVDLNDAVSRMFAGFRGIFQVVDLNESAVRVLSALRFVAQTISINEFTNATFIDIGTLNSRNVSDKFSINQFVSTTVLRVRYITQNININLLLARGVLAFKNIFEVLDLNDAAARVFLGFRGIFQVVDLNDSIFKIFGVLRSLFQVVDLNDGVSRLFRGTRGIFQIVDLNDAVFRTFIGTRRIFQIADLTDSVSRVFGVLKGVFQIVDLNDAVSRVFKPTRYVTQSININTAVSRLVLIFKIIYQQLSVNAVTGRFIGIPRNVNQKFSIFNGASSSQVTARIVNVYQSINVNTAIRRTASFFVNLFNILRHFLNPGLPTQEEPSPSPSPSVSTPSVGGGGPPKKKGFYASESEINIVMKAGSTQKVYFTITNYGTDKLDFQIKAAGLKDYITIPSHTFTLNPREDLEVEVIITAPQEPRTYTTSLIIEAGGRSLEIPVIINVETAKKLFDIKLEIPLKYQEVKAGDSLIVEAIIFNLGGVKADDVTLTYLLKDLADNIIWQDSEIVAVETRASFLKDIYIPPDYLKSGKYVIAAEVRYKDTVSSATSVITIVQESRIGYTLRMLGIIVMIMVIIIGLIYIILHIKKKHKNVYRGKGIFYKLKNAYRSIKNYRKRRIVEEMVSHGVMEARRLQKELAVTEKRLKKKEQNVVKLHEIQKRKAYLKKLAARERALEREMRKLRSGGRKVDSQEMERRRSYLKKLVKELAFVNSKTKETNREIKRLKSSIRG